MRTITTITIVFIFLMSINSISSLESLGVFKQNTTIRLVQVCQDASYINISSISYPNSTVIVTNIPMLSSGSGEYYYYFNGGNTTVTGRYDIRGISDGCEKTFAMYFDITPNGQIANEGIGIFYLGLLGILIIFLVLSIFAFIKFDNLNAKVGLFGLSYLLLISITFISWNMAQDFLTSSLFLINMLRILFIVLMVGVFPLVIGGFSWYVIMLFKIKEIERLMGKGYSYGEAERRSGKKYR